MAIDGNLRDEGKLIQIEAGGQQFPRQIIIIHDKDSWAELDPEEQYQVILQQAKQTIPEMEKLADYLGGTSQLKPDKGRKAD